MRTQPVTSVILRIVCGLVLMAVLGFCIFGFLITNPLLPARNDWGGQFTERLAQVAYLELSVCFCRDAMVHQDGACQKRNDEV